MTIVRTTCPYCGVGCGILVEQCGERFTVRGDPGHPANAGRLCSKGAALAETLGLKGRLLHPMLGGRRVGWDEALGAVAAGLGRTMAEHGSDALAFYVSGQLLTEDYYVANKLMKGFLGAANIDSNSRLCMASAVAAHKRAFGADVVPCSYADLDVADLVILVGSNLAWCHPVLYQRLAARRLETGAPRVVVVDPRRTASCAIADLHLPLRPGSDAALFNGLLLHLDRCGHRAADFVANATENAYGALAAAEASAATPAATAAACGLEPAQLEAFFALFAAHERVVTLFSQGVNQSATGTDKANAIINVHLLTGRIGHPGRGPFSITGQPNAMGGREVGALANQLAAHVDFDDPEASARVAQFWRSPRIARQPGLKAIDMFEAVEEGRVKALWVMATNPAVSVPESKRVRRALRRLDLLVVSDCMTGTDTARQAHVVLPAAAWGEKDGTVTNSERCISRQRAFRAPRGEARPDWWIICQVARRLGFGVAFDYAQPSQIFREHAALAAALGRPDLDIGALWPLDDAEYDAMTPTRWPIGCCDSPVAGGRFFTPSGRARFTAVTPRAVPEPCAMAGSLTLNTGRYRDQWHTMTRTGDVPRLCAHRPEPLVELHPEDALARGIEDGMIVRVTSRCGAAVLRCRISDKQPHGTAFAPIHWGDRFSATGRIGAVIARHVDPISGQPELKTMPVTLEPLQPRWHGVVLSALVLPSPCDVVYWALIATAGMWRLEMAGDNDPADRAASLHRAWQASGVKWLSSERPLGVHRSLLLTGGRAQVLQVLARDPSGLPNRTRLAMLFRKPCLRDDDVEELLGGTSVPPARPVKAVPVHTHELSACTP